MDMMNIIPPSIRSTKSGQSEEEAKKLEQLKCNPAYFRKKAYRLLQDIDRLNAVIF